MAAEPELDANGNITGNLLGVPSSGPGKDVQLQNWLAKQEVTPLRQLSDFTNSYFYSDSQNDIPLLERVSHPVATNPNAKLSAHALAKGWPQLHLFDKQ